MKRFIAWLLFFGLPFVWALATRGTSDPSELLWSTLSGVRWLAIAIVWALASLGAVTAIALAWGALSRWRKKIKSSPPG